MAWLALGTLTRELRDGEVVVGSGSDADWRVPTADLMPRHFTLTVHGLNVSTRPSTPEAVVAVNREQVTDEYHLLNDGDVVAAGKGRFIFTDDEPQGTQDMPEEALDEAYLVDEPRKSAYPLVNRSTTLGRDASNGIIIQDPRASRFHAEIRREAGGFALHTMGAAGTLLNGEAMRSPRLLRDGDLIEITFRTFRFTREALPPGISVRSQEAASNDAAAAQPTSVGPRSTLESAMGATKPPTSVMSWKVILVIAAIAAVALVVRLLVGR